MSAAQSSASASSADNQRIHRRVEVRLRVAVVLDRGTSCAACTENLSEGGMLIREYDGPPLKRGRLVGINMGGVLSDPGEEESQHYLMRVVRHDGATLALRFSGEH